MTDFTAAKPYSMPAREKRKFFDKAISRLTRHHYEQCQEYRNIIDARGGLPQSSSLAAAPMLPVRLFKQLSLKSVPEENLFKTVTSSGTTSQTVSRIFLDRDTARSQSRALSSIIQDFIGGKRLPMLIADHKKILSDRSSFSARGGGVLGMMPFGKDHFFLFDDDMSLNISGLRNFLRRHHNEQILIFGFTFIVWKYLLLETERQRHGITIPGGILIHSGGWKKLEAEAVDNTEFKQRFRASLGIKKIHNFYGMAEQLGSIFMECEHGHMHSSIHSDILIRNPLTWDVCPQGEPGVIELFSLLPKSYPGHVLLTEDMGVVQGEDDCPCGRLGKYFHVTGRIPRAEIRGCSDTFEAAS